MFSLPFAHKQDLHLWLEAMIPLDSVNQHLNHPSASPPLLYELPELLSTIDQATLSYQQDIILFLQFAEWRTTLSQHPTHIPTNPLTVPINDWHTYTPDLTHRPGSTPPPPKEYIDRFRQHIGLHFMTHATTHPLTPHALHISDYDITLILKKYNSPLILTIDGSFRPSPIHHIYPPH